MSDLRGWALFICSMFVALVLSVAPLPFDAPNWLKNLRPDWLVLIWFFWIVFQHERCSLIVAFGVGLLLDVLFGDPLGLNSLLLVSLIYVGRYALRWIEPSVGLRSSIALVILCFLVTAIKSLVQFITLDVQIQLGYILLPVLATFLCWIPFIPALNSKHSQFRAGVH